MLCVLVGDKVPWLSFKDRTRRKGARRWECERIEEEVKNIIDAFDFKFQEPTTFEMT